MTDDEVPVRRVFSQLYDSVFQPRVSGIRAPDDMPLANPLLARLRLDVILSGQVVLTDAQVLDGAWLRRVDPAQLVPAISVVPSSRAPMIIRCRQPSLEEAACSLLTTDSGKIKSFRFSSLTEGDAMRVEQGLLQASQQQVAGPTDFDEIDKVLGRAGLADLERNELLTTWKRWNDAQHAGQITIEQFDLAAGQRFRLMAVDALETDMQAFELPRHLPVGDLTETFSHGLSRTDIYRAIEAETYEQPWKVLLRSLTDRLFGLTFTHQHAADDFDDRTKLNLRKRGTRNQSKNQRQLADIGWSEIDASADFLPRLAAADGADLRKWATEFGRPLREWRQESNDAARQLEVALKRLDRDVLSAVRPARLEQMAGQQFNALPKTQEMLRRADFAGELAGAEASRLAGLLPLGSLIPTLIVVLKIGDDRRRRHDSHWRMISSDIAPSRRQRFPH